MIARNGIDYTNSVVELTWAEYSALSEEEQKNGSLYIVTDAPDEDFNANNVNYNNATSKIEATNVQDAIDKVYKSFTEVTNQIYGTSGTSNSIEYVITEDGFYCIHNSASSSTTSTWRGTTLTIYDENNNLITQVGNSSPERTYSRADTNITLPLKAGMKIVAASMSGTGVATGGLRVIKIF